MARITLTINGNVADAEQKIAVIKSDLKSIGQQTVKIRVDASGLEAVNKQIITYNNSEARRLNAMARVKEAENALSIETTKFATQLAKTNAEIAKTNTELAKKAVQTEKAAQAAAKAETQEAKFSTEVAKTGVQISKSVDIGMKAAETAKNYSDAVQDAAKSTSLLGDTLDRIVAKVAVWQLLNAAVSASIGTIRSAVAEMQAVDDELVTIRKVTGMVGNDLKAVEERAYATASAYGTAASEYLNTVATFERAGYGKQSEELAELSTKLQIVGDMSAETANQFIKVVDKAYAMNASVEELTRSIDIANELDNHYASSLESIAQGMGIVAPIAAQMHVSIEELEAALATIEAATGRPATENARALRALFLNIAGDTKTEIEEVGSEIKWTVGEIEGLRDVIRQYAPEAYEAAQATGSVIDPMEAVAGLAKSMKDGLLTEQELLSMVSDIGGKLRSSQLLSLIQNWELYESMLARVENAAGSADKEVENALDSWTRKTARLSDEWTQFISHIVETDEVKSTLDTLIVLVDALDSPIGEATVKAGLLTVAFVALNKATKGALLSNLSLLIQHFMGVRSAELLAAEAAGTLDAALLGLKIVAVVALVYAAVKAVDALNTTTEEHLELLDEASSKYDEEKSKLDELNTKLKENTELLEAANKEGASEAYKNRLITENDELERQILLQKEIARRAKEKETEEAAATLTDKNYSVGTGKYRTYRRGDDEVTVEITESADIVTYTESLLKTAEAEGKVDDELLDLAQTLILVKDKLDPSSEAYAAYAKRIEDAAKETDELIKALNTEEAAVRAQANLADVSRTVEGLGMALGRGALSAEEYANKLTEFAGGYKAYYDALKSQKNAGEELADTQLHFIDIYETMLSELERLGVKIESVAIDTAALAAAMEEVEKKGSLTYRTLEELDKLYPGLSKKIVDASGNLTEQGRAALESKGAFVDLIAQEIIFNNTALDVSQQVAALQTLAMQAGVTGALVSAAFSGGLSKAIQDEVDNEMSYAQARQNILGSYSRKIQQEIKNQTYIPTGDTSKASASEKDPELEALKDAVTLEKQRLSLLEASNASDDERIAKMHDIQSALHDQAEYLRSIGASEADIKALSTEWWTIQSKIAKVYDDAAEAAKKLREEQEQAARDAFYDYVDAVTAALDAERDKQVDVLQAQLDKLTAQHDAVEEQRQEQEKLLAVEKARIALQNAKNQRTVRQYNHATNQWEWVANAKTVEDAEKAFADAQATLTEYRENRLYEQQKKAIEDQIDATKTAFDAQKKAWEDAAGAVRAGTLSVQDALKNGASDITSASAQVQTALQNLLATLNTAVQTAQAQKTPNGAFATTASGQTIAAPSGSDIAIYADNGSYKTYDSNGNWTGGGGNSASYHFDPSAATRTDYSGADPTKYYDVNGNVTGTRPGYDSGGVLHGLGGIKATREDELILPPDLTKTVIRPALDGATARALDNMRVVYGMKPAQSMTLAYGNTYADSGTHIETQYVVNGMTISQDSAKYLTVEAAMRFLRSANNLPLYYRS